MQGRHENRVQHSQRATVSYAFEWPASKTEYNVLRLAAQRGFFSPEFYFIHEHNKKPVNKMHISFSTVNNNYHAELARIGKQLDKYLKFEGFADGEAMLTHYALDKK